MPRRFVIFAALFFAALMSAPASAQIYPGFTHCAPPVRPGCIATAPRADAVCEDEVRLFVTATFQYRECLARETERAVRDVNDAILAWRCRADKKQCRR